jgi:hypothetical protein
MNKRRPREETQRMYGEVKALMEKKGISALKACAEVGMHKSNFYCWRDKEQEGDEPKPKKPKKPKASYEAIAVPTTNDNAPFSINGSPAQLAAFVKSLSMEFSR